jgi:phosphoserine phosphatase
MAGKNSVKKLVVVDLDKTLISKDSFRLLVQDNLSLTIGFWLCARVLGMVSRSFFAAKVQSLLALTLSDRQYLEDFLGRIGGLIDPRVTKLIDDAAPKEAQILILSASPHAYVQPFAQRLGFVGEGSRFDQSGYLHLYGQAKRDFVIRNYPSDQYELCLSVSDSESDLPLLSLFQRAYLYKKGRFDAV